MSVFWRDNINLQFNSEAQNVLTVSVTHLSLFSFSEPSTSFLSTSSAPSFSNSSPILLPPTSWYSSSFPPYSFSSSSSSSSSDPEELLSSELDSSLDVVSYLRHKGEKNPQKLEGEVCCWQPQLRLLHDVCMPHAFSRSSRVGVNKSLRATRILNSS